MWILVATDSECTLVTFHWVTLLWLHRLYPERSGISQRLQPSLCRELFPLNVLDAHFGPWESVGAINSRFMHLVLFQSSAPVLWDRKTLRRRKKAKQEAPTLGLGGFTVRAPDPRHSQALIAHTVRTFSLELCSIPANTRALPGQRLVCSYTQHFWGSHTSLSAVRRSYETTLSGPVTIQEMGSSSIPFQNVEAVHKTTNAFGFGSVECSMPQNVRQQGSFRPRSAALPKTHCELKPNSSIEPELITRLPQAVINWWLKPVESDLQSGLQLNGQHGKPLRERSESRRQPQAQVVTNDALAELDARCDMFTFRKNIGVFQQSQCWAECAWWWPNIHGGLGGKGWMFLLRVLCPPCNKRPVCGRGSARPFHWYALYPNCQIGGTDNWTFLRNESKWHLCHRSGNWGTSKRTRRGAKSPCCCNKTCERTGQGNVRMNNLFFHNNKTDSISPESTNISSWKKNSATVNSLECFFCLSRMVDLCVGAESFWLKENATPIWGLRWAQGFGLLI